MATDDSSERTIIGIVSPTVTRVTDLNNSNHAAPSLATAAAAAAESPPRPSKKRRKSSIEMQDLGSVDGESLVGGPSSSVEGASDSSDLADSMSTQQANEYEVVDPSPPSQGRTPLHTPAPWAHVSSSRALLNGLPSCQKNEVQFTVENWTSSSTADVITSPELVIDDRFRCQLIVHPRVVRESNKPSIILRVLEPPCVTQEKIRVENSNTEGEELSWDISRWICTEVFFYVTILDFTDWKRSPYYHDKLVIHDESPDRQYLSLLDNQEKMQRCTGPEGQLVYRFGIQPGGLTWRDSDVGYRGLRNHGTTCYLNSLLQCLYQVGGFRKAVWETTIEEDNKIVEEHKRVEMSRRRAAETSTETTASMSDTPKTASILDGMQLLRECELGFESQKDLSSDDADVIDLAKYAAQQVAIGDVLIEASDRNNLLRALQKIFYLLGDTSSQHPVPCEDLLVSFGWNSADLFTQHDAQELNRLLCDRLEEKMKTTPADGSIKKLFGGELEVFIECLNVAYESKRTEVFYDLQLDIQNVASMVESLEKYVEPEILDGENQYHAEGHGPQPARKGVRFLKFPPVLQFHLKRFEFDLQTMDMIKLDSYFEFPEKINFDQWCPNAGDYQLFAVDVHQGDVHQGHYYTFIKTFGDVGLRDRLWLKFDDENVSLVDKYTAVDGNYGGRSPSLSIPLYMELKECLDSIRHLAPRPVTQLKHYSAYILFYIKVDLIHELLTCPPPTQVNPGMALRCKVQDALLKRRESERRRKEETLIIKFITEHDLRKQPKGFWSTAASLPIRKSIRRPRKMAAYEFWRETVEMIEAGKLGDDLRQEYIAPNGQRKGFPALFYLEFSGPPAKAPPQHLCGWQAEFCRESELGVGLRLWFLEMKQAPQDPRLQSTTSDLGTNFGYLGNDLLEPDVLFILILPLSRLTMPTITRLPNIQELTEILESYTPSPIKLFDTTPDRAQDQNVYFVGFVDILTRNDSHKTEKLCQNIYSKLIFTWMDPVKRKHIIESLPPSSSLALLLDKHVAELRQHNRITTNEDGEPLVELSRGRINFALWTEHRGYVAAINTIENDIDGRSLIFSWGGTQQQDAYGKDAYTRKLKTLWEELPSEIDVNRHKTQSQCFFGGDPTPWPSVMIPSASLPVETILQNIPPLYGQSAVSDWIVQLRLERQLHVEVYDIAQHLGRWEGLKGQPLKAAGTEDMEDVPKVTPLYELRSHHDTVEPIKRLTVPVHLSWSESIFFEWLTSCILDCDPRYLAWFQCKPFEPSQDYIMPSYECEMYKDTLEPRPLTQLKRDLGKARTMKATFGRLCKFQPGVGGATPLFSSVCAEPVSTVPPTLMLGLLPRAFLPSSQYIWVRIFTNAYGSLGTVLIDEPQRFHFVQDLIKEAKSKMDTLVISQRVDDYKELIKQEFDLVECTTTTLRRYDPQVRWERKMTLVSNLVFTRLLRIEPSLQWLPLHPTQPQPSPLVAANFIHVDMTTGRAFGYPFAMLIAGDERVESVRERMMKHFGFALGPMAGVKWYKTDNITYNSEVALKPLQDNDVIFSIHQVSAPNPIALPYASTRYTQVPFTIVLKHPMAENLENSQSPKTTMSLRRRANPSLHISS